MVEENKQKQENKEEKKETEKKLEEKVVESKVEEKPKEQSDNKPSEQQEQVSTETSKIIKEETKADEKPKVEEKKEETKKEAKKEDKKKKKEEKVIVKKEDAVARGTNLHISKKHGVYICSFIKNKKIDDAIGNLERVRRFKQAVPFKGEIPHRRGKGMMSGRYPIKGALLFIGVLKALRGNSIVNGLDLDKTRIHYASASWGSRPMRSKRREGKRTNVILKAKEVGTKEASK